MGDKRKRIKNFFKNLSRAGVKSIPLVGAFFEQVIKHYRRLCPWDMR